MVHWKLKIDAMHLHKDWTPQRRFRANILYFGSGCKMGRCSSLTQKWYLLNIHAWSQADVEFVAAVVELVTATVEFVTAVVELVTAAEPLAIAQWSICRRPTRLTI